MRAPEQVSVCPWPVAIHHPGRPQGRRSTRLRFISYFLLWQSVRDIKFTTFITFKCRVHAARLPCPPAGRIPAAALPHSCDLARPRCLTVAGSPGRSRRVGAPGAMSSASPCGSSSEGSLRGGRASVVNTPRAASAPTCEDTACVPVPVSRTRGRHLRPARGAENGRWTSWKGPCPAASPAAPPPPPPLPTPATWASGPGPGAPPGPHEVAPGPQHLSLLCACASRCPVTWALPLAARCRPRAAMPRPLAPGRARLCLPCRPLCCPHRLGPLSPGATASVPRARPPTSAGAVGPSGSGHQAPPGWGTTAILPAALPLGHLAKRSVK